MQNLLEVGACGGRIQEICEVDPPGWFDTFKVALAISPNDETYGWITDPDKYLAGAGLSIRQSALRDIFALGFTPTMAGRTGTFLLSGEDLELGAALRLAGWKLWREESLTVKHFIPASRLTWPYMKSLYYGFGASGFSPYEVLLFARVSRLRQILKTTFFWQVLFTAKRGLLAILRGARTGSASIQGRSVPLIGRSCMFQLEYAWFAGRLSYLIRNWLVCRKHRKTALTFLSACRRRGAGNIVSSRTAPTHDSLNSSSVEDRS
jgi:hypothetical protein